MWYSVRTAASRSKLAFFPLLVCFCQFSSPLLARDVSFILLLLCAVTPSGCTTNNANSRSSVNLSKYNKDYSKEIQVCSNWLLFDDSSRSTSKISEILLYLNFASEASRLKMTLWDWGLWGLNWELIQCRDQAGYLRKGYIPEVFCTSIFEIGNRCFHCWKSNWNRPSIIVPGKITYTFEVLSSFSWWPYYCHPCCCKLPQTHGMIAHS